MKQFDLSPNNKMSFTGLFYSPETLYVLRVTLNLIIFIYEIINVLINVRKYR